MPFFFFFFFCDMFFLVPCLRMAFLVTMKSEPLWVVWQSTEPGRSLGRALLNSSWIAVDGPQVMLPCLAARALPQQMVGQERHFPEKTWFSSPRSPNLPVWRDALGLGPGSICACSGEFAGLWVCSAAPSVTVCPQQQPGLSSLHQEMESVTRKTEVWVLWCESVQWWGCGQPAACCCGSWPRGCAGREGIGICSSTAERFDYRNSSYKEVIGTSSPLMSAASSCKSLHQRMPPFPPFLIYFFLFKVEVWSGEGGASRYEESLEAAAPAADWGAMGSLLKALQRLCLLGRKVGQGQMSRCVWKLTSSTLLVIWNKNAHFTLKKPSSVQTLLCHTRFLHRAVCACCKCTPELLVNAQLALIEGWAALSPAWPKFPWQGLLPCIVPQGCLCLWLERGDYL